MSQNKGILVIIEGIDGVGKSTLAKRLANRLSDIGKDVVATFEPTNGQYGKQLRQSFTGEKRLTLAQELELFMLDRKEHVEQVFLPSLAQGKVIVCDRYYFSTMAYQGARGADFREIQRQNEAFAPVPDLLLIPVLPVRDALERIRLLRGEKPNNFEGFGYLEAVSRIFDTITGDYVFRLDAMLGMKALEDEAMRIFEKRFGG